MRFDTFYQYNGSGIYMESWHVQEYQLHIHSDIELQLILTGSVECHVSHRIYALSEGDILLTNRKQPHALVLPSPNCTAIWAAINPAFCRSYFPELSKIRFRDVLFHQNHPLNANLRKCLLQMYDCCRLHEAHSEFKIHEILNHIAYLLLSNTQYSTLSLEEADLERRNEQRIAQVIDYVEHNYSMQPRLKDLSERMNLSEDYLSHFIKDTLGVTFREYLTHVRLRHAVELMRNQATSQLDILLQTGFSDYRYFLRAFTRVYGCSPEAYLSSEIHACV